MLAFLKKKSTMITKKLTEFGTYIAQIIIKKFHPAIEQITQITNLWSPATKAAGIGLRSLPLAVRDANPNFALPHSLPNACDRLSDRDSNP